MKVLVTGGAGFIGSHLVDALLSAGHAVGVIDDLSTGTLENLNPRAKFFQADVRDPQAVDAAFAEFRPDWVSHQAAQMSVSRSVREPAFDADVNLVGLCNVGSAAVAHGVKRIVFASSGGVMYGDVTAPAAEDHPANPLSPYGIAKWAGERYLQFFTKQHGVATVALRYANVYGPRQNPLGEAGVVAIFCTKYLTGDTPTINGDGKYIRDYVHVSDVVAANVAALQSSLTGFHAFNVGTGRPTDVNDIARELSSACKNELAKAAKSVVVQPPLHGPARPGDLRSNLVAWDKIHDQLAWSPRTDLEAGLKETAAWFAKQILKA